MEFTTWAKELETYAKDIKVAQIQDEVLVTQDGKVLMMDDRDQTKETAEILAAWSDIVAVGASSTMPDAYYYGLKADGTIVDSKINRGNATLEEFSNLEWIQIITDVNRTWESIVGYTKDHKVLAYSTEKDFYEWIASFSEDPYSMRERMRHESDYDRSVAWYRDTEIYASVCEEASKVKQYDSNRTFLTSVMVQEDGTAVFWSGFNEPVVFENVKQVPDDDNLILKNDGTVEIVDHGMAMSESYKPKEKFAYVESWTDVDQIMECQNVVYGLKNDGTLVTDSDYMDEEFPLMKKIFSNGFLALGIIEDDRVFVIQRDSDSEEKGMTHVDTWANVADLAIGNSHTAALLHDGTVLATGRNDRGQCNVEEWTNIEKIYVGEQCTLGIDKDGNLLMAGVLH